MSNDNLQGMPPALPTQQNMPPKPPVQPNQPPAPPTNPTMSRLTPPVPPQQTANTGTTMPSQPPAPPNANSTQPGPQQQQLPTNADQPQTPPMAPTAEMPEQPNTSTPTGPKTSAGAILTEKPQYNLKNMLGEAFAQFLNFYDCSTRLTWWVGSILIDVAYAIVFRLFIGSPVILCALTLYFSVCWLALCTRRIRDAGNGMSYMAWPIIVVLCQNIILYLMFSDDSIYYAETIMYLYMAECVCSLITLCTFGFYKTLIRADSKPRYIHYA